MEVDVRATLEAYRALRPRYQLLAQYLQAWMRS